MSMATAIIGLVGVFLGAAMTQLGAFLTDRRQVRSEAARWARNEKAAAYDGAIRHLLRAANRRSKLDVHAGAILSQEGVGQMFDDLVEAQFWLHALATRCGSSQRERIANAAQLLDKTVEAFAYQGPAKERPGS